MLVSQHFWVAIRLAIKVRFFWMAIGSLLFVALVMLLSAYFGGRQPVTVALDVGFSTIRIVLPLLIVLLVQELFSQEFDRRYYLNSLAYPNARSNLLLGRYMAVLILVLVLLVALGVLQVFLVGFIADVYPQATPVALRQEFLIVIGFIAVDFLVLTTLAVMLAIVASTPSFVLIGTFGFMLVARSYGSIVELLGQGGGVVSNAEEYKNTLGLLSYFLPDLGALDVRMIALYGRLDFLSSDWTWVLFTNFAYMFFLLTIAVWFLQRKRFS